MKANDNKNSYFKVSYKLSDKATLTKDLFEKSKIKIENNLHEMLGKLNASNLHFIENDNDDLTFYYLFKTASRKRVGQIRNILDKNMAGFDIQTQAQPLTKSDFVELIKKCENNSSLTVVKENVRYTGQDLNIFKDKENWWQWQKDLVEMVFRDDFTVKEAKSREIILIRDRQGNSGKSTFVKYLWLQNSEDIGFLIDGTATQIRAGVVGQQQKKVYFVDLPRTSCSEANMAGLMTALEDVKNGLVHKIMYGSGRSLLFDQVPWVILFSNDLPIGGGFSPDRWKVFDLKTMRNISKNSKKDVGWIDISQQMQELAEDKILIDMENEKQKQREIRVRARNIREELKKRVEL